MTGYWIRSCSNTIEAIEEFVSLRPVTLGSVMPLTLILNGHNRDFATLSPASTLEQLIAELGLKGDRVAVEHNGEIVPRAQWTETPLSDSDRLEVVQFVGGGRGEANSCEPCAVPVSR